MRTKTNLIAAAVFATLAAGAASAGPSGGPSTIDQTSPSSGTYGSPSSSPMGPSTAPDAGMPSTGTTGASTPSAASDAQFAKMDKDHDGAISKKEGGKNKDMAKKWDTLDMNRDGKLDQAEFAQFESMSTDKMDSSGKMNDKMNK